MLREIRKLDRRIDFLNNAIFLSVASAILVCLVVVLLFSAQLFGAPMGTPVALLFIIAMLLMISALCTFLVEIRLASSTIHIANEVLSYRDRKSTTSAIQSLMRTSYAVFCLKKKITTK